MSRSRWHTSDARTGRGTFPNMGRFLRDIRFALRLFAKAPGFTATAVLTLAVGIGANTSIFSVADALLLRPLAYRDPEGLVMIEARRQSENVRQGPLTYTRFEQVSRN